MGSDGRVPYPLNPDSDTGDPFEAGVERWATQPPMGCRYVDSSGTYTPLTVNVSTTLDFLATAGDVQYDPYKMIDLTADSVQLPTPGIWDIAFEAQFANATAAGDHLYVQFGQGLFAVSGTTEMTDDAIARAAGEFKRVSVSMPYYVSRATLGNGSLFYLRAVCLGSNGLSKIISFSAWLRSAVVPSKY